MNPIIKATLLALAMVACGYAPIDEYDGRAGIPLEPEGFYGQNDTVPELISGTATATDEIGSVRQPIMTVTNWQGWQTNTRTMPGFLDIGSTDFSIVGACGAFSDGNGGGCLFPKGIDEKTTWKWRWDRNLCGFLDSGVTGSYAGDAFIRAVRAAMSEISFNTGITMSEVTSGEDITIFCDANAVSVIDIDDSTGAAWFPFGTPGNSRRNIKPESDGGCLPSIRTQTAFGGEEVWAYNKAGIVIGADTLGNPRDSNGWANPSVCSGATDPRKPNFMFNVFRNVILHEMLHHFGFGHYDLLPLMKASLPCTIGDSPIALQSTFRNAIGRLQTKRCTGGSPGSPNDCSIVFTVDRDLECLSPHVASDPSVGSE